MSILTNLPVTLTCGTPATVTLDPAQLITDFGIVDPYWSNSVNWRQCKFVYGSDQASQKTKINFTITTGILSLATNAYDGGWECSGIFITDGLENQIVFQRSEFPVASEFDFASTGGYVVSNLVYSRDYNAPNTAQAYETLFPGPFPTVSTIAGGLLTIVAGSGGYRNTAPSLTYILGNTYKIRLYIDSVVIGLGTLDVSVQFVGVGGTISQATLVAAIGSFIDITFVATAPMVAGPIILDLAPSSSDIAFSLVEIFDIT